MTLENMRKQVPIHKKWGLNFAECSAYTGIGEGTIRRYVKEHQDDDFFITVGTKTLIKRKKFEEILDTLSSI